MHLQSTPQNGKFPDRGPHSAVAVRGHERTVLPNTPLYFPPTNCSEQAAECRNGSHKVATLRLLPVHSHHQFLRVLLLLTFCHTQPSARDVSTQKLPALWESTHDNGLVHRRSAVVQQADNSMLMYVGVAN